MVFLVLAIVIVLVWALNVPAARFLPGFATLLHESDIQHGRFSFLTGRSYLTGRFRTRRVAVRLQRKRGRYNLGYLVVAMETRSSKAYDGPGLEGRASERGASDILFQLKTEEGLSLALEYAWLKATWMPVGLIIFPGRFDPDRWRRVLELMDALASRVEA